MLSQTAEYALRAMTQLAASAPNVGATHDIAKRSEVPAAYLAKVFSSTTRAGLTTSRRGPGGGVKLARPPKRISLLEIVKAVDGAERKVDAPKGKAGATLAPLNGKVDALLSQYHKSLAATSLADVAPRFAKPK